MFSRKSFLALAVLLAGCAAMSAGDYRDRAAQMMKGDFSERGQAGLGRLDQDETQALCSRRPADGALDRDAAARIEKLNLDGVRYPAAGRLLGDWREGEKIAQSGVGKQFSDNPKAPSGGNCYACHQLSPEELSFGTIGPSLRSFAKTRGGGEAMQRYVYAKIYNPEAFTACSSMPRFGRNGILTEDQIRHLTALLLDPQSPVNR
ncbi:MAG TPA: sulfur oxidation c-type cytochrome SoxX [Burkholderiales bacterium]|nr:sulfur oxidation c-type cytochrome SoxX [Burkholderiales bacterium]